MVNTRKSFKFTSTDKDKRIEELERKLEKETTQRIYNFNKAIEWKEKHRTLKKEFAKLKNKLNKIERKCKFNFVDLLHDVENESKQEEQLSKAKKLIEGWLGDFYNPKAFYRQRAELVEQSEQFLKDASEKEGE